MKVYNFFSPLKIILCIVSCIKSTISCIIFVKGPLFHYLVLNIRLFSIKHHISQFFFYVFSCLYSFIVVTLVCI